MIVPAGHIVVTGYVPIDKIIFENDVPMAAAAVEKKIVDFTATGEASYYPPPVGRWEGDRFRLLDGRHRYIASLMLGRKTLLAAWLEKAK